VLDWLGPNQTCHHPLANLLAFRQKCQALTKESCEDPFKTRSVSTMESCFYHLQRGCILHHKAAYQHLLDKKKTKSLQILQLLRRSSVCAAVYESESLCPAPECRMELGICRGAPFASDTEIDQWYEVVSAMCDSWPKNPDCPGPPFCARSKVADKCEAQPRDKLYNKVFSIPLSHADNDIMLVLQQLDSAMLAKRRLCHALQRDSGSSDVHADCSRSDEVCLDVNQSAPANPWQVDWGLMKLYAVDRNPLIQGRDSLATSTVVDAAGDKVRDLLQAYLSKDVEELLYRLETQRAPTVVVFKPEEPPESSDKKDAPEEVVLIEEGEVAGLVLALPLVIGFISAMLVCTIAFTKLRSVGSSADDSNDHTENGPDFAPLTTNTSSDALI